MPFPNHLKIAKLKALKNCIKQTRELTKAIYTFYDNATIINGQDSIELEILKDIEKAEQPDFDNTTYTEQFLMRFDPDSFDSMIDLVLEEIETTLDKL